MYNNYNAQKTGLQVVSWIKHAEIAFGQVFVIWQFKNIQCNVYWRAIDFCVTDLIYVY